MAKLPSRIGQGISLKQYSYKLKTPKTGPIHQQSAAGKHSKNEVDIDDTSMISRHLCIILVFLTY